MKSIKGKTKLNMLILCCLTLVIAVSLSSCIRKKIPFLTSSVVPAAEGVVFFKKDNNNNFFIQIQISNLADIEKLQPARKTYVVWIETGHNAVTNIGRIASSDKLNVSFETVSAVRPIRVFITAEEDETTRKPGEVVVLTTDEF